MIHCDSNGTAVAKGGIDTTLKRKVGCILPQPEADVKELVMH